MIPQAASPRASGATDRPRSVPLSMTIEKMIVSPCFDTVETSLNGICLQIIINVTCFVLITTSNSINFKSKIERYLVNSEINYIIFSFKPLINTNCSKSTDNHDLGVITNDILSSVKQDRTEKYAGEQIQGTIKRLSVLYGDSL